MEPAVKPTDKVNYLQKTINLISKRREDFSLDVKKKNKKDFKNTMKEKDGNNPKVF